MIDRSIISKYVHVPANKRVVAISDIHANLPVLKKLLSKIHYDPLSDELFLVGDLLEKGCYNLETLSFIMELSKYPSVHAMMGNCDFVCKNIYHAYRLDFLKEVLLQRKHSVLHEMADKLHMKIDIHSDMQQVAKRLKEAFPKEFAFMIQLPHVVETERFIFGHAAILNEETYGYEMRDIMTHDHFFYGDHYFQKYVIVGHLPVSEYCKTICCFNPLFDHERHIICIDGGNGVKHAGQLNALIIQNGIFSYAHSDALPKAMILENIQPTQQDAFFITWHDREIQILQKQSKVSLCKHIRSGKKIWIPNAFINKSQDGMHAENYTNYQLPVYKNDLVKVVSTHHSHALVKKHGVMGWIPSHTLHTYK